ncbi:photosynthetic apparatus regulatory protein RegA [mine drainage metagenome]|uniref:Photosynthetic apparatus regulatory protein RegA n=1 Tax=mine drainage metagenome TaxID=410659 RepID=A0A1J5QIK0_9ZZZZ
MTPGGDQPSLLLVDDDPTFCDVMARALKRRGFAVTVAHDVATAVQLAEPEPPEYALVDLKMPGDSGLALVRQLHALDPATRIVMLTGYAGIATAVEAIKLGATHYLAKPADADEVVKAFSRSEGDAHTSVAPSPLTVDRLEWEHLQRVLGEHDGNISATARALNMHRRTLQRKLAKSPPRNQR